MSEPSVLHPETESASRAPTAWYEVETPLVKASVRRLLAPLGVLVNYGLVALFWDAGVRATISWMLMGCLAAAVAATSIRRMERRLGLGAAVPLFLSGAAFSIAGSLLAAASGGHGEHAYSVAWAHAIVTALGVQRGARHAGHRSGDLPLYGFVRAIRRIAVALYLGWLFVLGLQGRLLNPADLALTTWTGLLLGMLLLDERLVAANAAFGEILEYFGASARARRFAERPLALDLPQQIARSAREAQSEHRLAMAAELLETLRAASTSAPPDVRRRYAAASIEAQWSLGRPGRARLIARMGTTCGLEATVLARWLLAVDPPALEKHEARWLKRALWLMTRDDPELMGRVVSLSEALLHDGIKHGVRQLDGVLSDGRCSKASAALPGEAHRRIRHFLDDLIDRFQSLDARLRPTTPPEQSSATSGLLADDLATAAELRRRTKWTSAESAELEVLLGRCRTILGRFVDLARTNLPRVVAEIVRELPGKDSDACPVEISFDAARVDSLYVIAPPEALEVVVRNLAQNAQTWALRGDREPRVWIRIDLAGDPRHPVVEVAVEDSGPGVRPEDRERIWSRGTGLGLVAREVGRLGGDVAVVDSSLGGAAFRVRVPRCSM
jgi:signal transduction histidine kinase